MNVIEAADKENKWAINYDAVWQIWRGGCIIQADWISDNILKPVLLGYKERKSINLLMETSVMKVFKDGYPILKDVLGRCSAADFVVPALSATAEYILYQSNTSEYNLPVRMSDC